MRSRLAAQRYARALCQVLKDSDLEPALAQLRRFCDILSEHHDFHSALNNPAIGISTREKVLDTVLDKLGVLNAVRNVLGEMLRRERMNEVGDMVEAFSHEVDERLRRVTVSVTTAHELSAEDESRLLESLEAYTDKAVRLKKLTDEEVIGGVQARIGDTIIDGTLRAQLNRLRESLLAQEIA